MEQIFGSIRRPSGFESVTCSKALLDETWKHFPSLRSLFTLTRTGDEGSLGFTVKKPNDTRPPKRVIEIHVDEVSIHCSRHMKRISKQMGVPVWRGTSNGNLKYHLWGESVDLYCITSRTQRKLGKGYIIQKPPHFDSIEYASVDEESVMIRLDSYATHQKVQKCNNNGYNVVAMFDSVVRCNPDFCIGSGIDNAVSWYVLCKALSEVTSFYPFLLQLSVKEEIGKTELVFPPRMLKDMEVVCMDTELSELTSVCVDQGIVIDSNSEWWNSRKHTQRLQEKQGGTNLGLLKRHSKRWVQFGIPITGMHSANEQVSQNIIQCAIYLLQQYLKLKL